MRVGLVLSGGGAKGAYQAGIVKSLANHGVEVDVVSGASIGALNGAILSASGSTLVAAKRLEEVWGLVAKNDVLKLNIDAYPRYLAMLAAAGLTGASVLGLKLLSDWAGLDEGRGVLNNSPLRNILDQYLDEESISCGKPLYVSLYPYKGGLHALSEFVKGDVLKRFDTKESIFLLVQELSFGEQKEVLLASAAIPVLFAPRKVGGKLYSDGGQGDYRRSQGNTPIAPLVGKGLDVIFVSHLSDGAMWDADDFPDETILEIRPSERISKNGIRDMLGFDSQSISMWMEQGERDADALLKKLARFSFSKTSMDSASENLKEKVKDFKIGLESKRLEDAMRKLERGG